METDNTLISLYEKLITLPFGSPNYKRCLEEIGTLEYRDNFGKTVSGEKKNRETNQSVRFLKGIY